MIGSGGSGTGVGTSGTSCGTIGPTAGVAPSYNVGSYGARGIEGQIMTYVFKVLVTRLVDSMKQLKTQENIGLYCDVRQLMTYVKEAHGGIFRRVALSGILDSADRPNKRCNSNVQTTRVIRFGSRCFKHFNLENTSNNGKYSRKYFKLLSFLYFYSLFFKFLVYIYNNHIQIIFFTIE